MVLANEIGAGDLLEVRIKDPKQTYPWPVREVRIDLFLVTSVRHVPRVRKHNSVVEIVAVSLEPESVGRRQTFLMRKSMPISKRGLTKI